MQAPFYSPTQFNSTASVFTQHLASVVAQQRTNSRNLLSVTPTPTEFDTLDANVTLHAFMMITKFAMRKYTVAEFFQDVALSRHYQIYRSQPGRKLYLS